MDKLGIDIGTSSIKLVLLNQKQEIAASFYELHMGNIQPVLQKALKAVEEKITGRELFCMVSGSSSALLTRQLPLKKANEFAALMEGALFLCPNASSVIEMGGQSSKYITNLQAGKSRAQFAMNNHCAAGTGSFFEDQMQRLGLPMGEYSNYIQKAQSIPRIAGRCSVFAKTDIIHHQQEGVSSPDILLGLSYAMVRNYKSTIVKNLPVQKPVLIAGGVAYNQGVLRAVKEVFGLSDEELLIPNHVPCLQAAGTALLAEKNNQPVLLSSLQQAVEKLSGEKSSEIIRLPRLNAQGSDITRLHHCSPQDQSYCTPCSLGIDIGSTSTNLVLADKAGNVLDYQYLRTRGNPKQAVQNGLDSIRCRFGDTIVITSVGTTGSGRYLIGKLVGADAIRDEITAQATAALSFDPQVDTIFEIGGQDSKYISCQNGSVSDFQMNKICAAGTGSFLEEQANRFGIPIEQFGSRALAAHSPVDLGERCTVFIETNISTCLAQGMDKNDITAGLCYSVVRNYLTKVVAGKPIGNRIFLQGGIAHNPGIVAAFRHYFGEKLSVPPFFSVSGALGAALLAQEAVGTGTTKFSGYQLPQSINTAPATESERVKNSHRLQMKSKQLFLGSYDGPLDPAKKTVGIPRVLMIHRMFPMFHAFFKELGYNVLLSEETNEKTVRDSQEYSKEETCYPVKLIHGHMLELAQKKVDYIFLPRLHTMQHEISKVSCNYGCVYMQTAPQIAAKAIGLEQTGIPLLSPVLSLQFGKKQIASAMLSVGKQLGKNQVQTMAAMMKGVAALAAYGSAMEQLGQQAVDRLSPNEIAFVVITRNYGLTDPVLNMGIAKTITERGYQVLTLPHLPAHDINTSCEFPNLYWPFGQHILSGAQLVRQHPNLYAIYLTNHGCGPDTMLSHLFREQMGDKPYLAIEVDEHSSPVGVITRIEAFISSLQSRKKTTQPIKSLPAYAKDIPHPVVNIQNHLPKGEKDTVCIPWLYPYSQLIAEDLTRQGYSVKCLPPTSPESLAVGKSLTQSKEYLSFAALLGDVITQTKKTNDCRFLLYQTEGAEADGQYSRVIRAILNKEGYQKAKITAPCLEQLPNRNESLCRRLFLLLLAGDVVLSAPALQRQPLLDHMLKQIQKGSLSFHTLLQMTQTIQPEKTDSKRLLVVGEPACIFNSLLNNHVLRQTEQQGYRLHYSPMSEYMLFLWKSHLSESTQKSFENQIQKAAECLGANSSFSTDFSKLVETADKTLPMFSGGNGQYRFAKSILGLPGVHGILNVASMYENTATILNLLSENRELPCLSLSFDGNPGSHDELRISSFLCYL
ncbi:acyl-CoA dehydratase activase [Clostridium minihomine]|uniref:acyl-CoA dehydratase activase n=1 Tax=Clostridium minihomine TaxID=2045012 RepID=UPI000C77938D|nr:acyl-CoA dehydratase activase [Clostridium minihomine]